MNALLSAAFNNPGIHHTRVAAGRIVAAVAKAGRTVASAGAEAGRIVAAGVEAGRTVAAGVEAGRTVAAAADKAASAAEAEVGCTAAAAAAAGVGVGCKDLGVWIVPDSSRFGFVHCRVLPNVVGPRELVGFPRGRA